MANPEHLDRLKQGVTAWNEWRKENPEILVNLYQANLSYAQLSGANLSHANLTEANLTEANLSKANLNRTSLRRAILRGANLDRVNLEAANLEDVNLSGLNLRGINFHRAFLERVNLDSANLCDANLTSANLKGANLKRANFKGATLWRATLCEASLEGVNLEGINLEEANLSRANLSRANLSGVNLEFAYLGEVNLSYANLSRANLEDANLEGANLEGVLFSKTNLNGANLNGVTLEGVFDISPTAIPTNTERLFVTFLSPAAFYSNPVRSFLQHLQKSDRAPFQLVNFPKNLYTASETLVEDNQSLTLSLQLLDGSQHPLAIAITPTQNGSSMLTLDFGNADVAKYLVGEEGDDASIAWLTDVLSTGGRMMRTDCAFVSFEAQPNQISKVRLEQGRLHLEQLPLILWTTAALSSDLSAIAKEAWKAEQQSDGAWLLIPNSLPEKGRDETQHSLWVDSTQTRYFLIPTRQKLKSGDFILHNLDGEEKKVNATSVTPFEITEEEANTYLQTEIEQVMEQAKNALSNLITSSVAQGRVDSTSTPSSDEFLSNLMAALMGVTPEEVKNNPATAEAGLQNLLSQLKAVIHGSLSEDPAQLETARDRMRSLQVTLKSHSIELGEALEKFPDRLHELQRLSKQTPDLQQTTAKLRELADKIDPSSADKSLSLGEVMAAFVQTYQKLFGKEDEAQAEERRQREYREIADQAIAQSLSKHPMPSLKFEDLLPKTSQQQEDEQK
jgi:uncharacterized protein YjbI with pentapeptide repeats